MKISKALLLSVLTLTALTFVCEVQAQAPTQQKAQLAQTNMTEDYNTYQLISRKLGRGISNAAFGALELPIVVLDVNFNEGGIAALTYGVFQGLGVFICRELVGVLEICTFFMPLPNCPVNPYGVGWGYGPIMRPEWIITPETNAYNFVFPTSKTLY